VLGRRNRQQEHLQEVDAEYVVVYISAAA
jgi:hypothetical protein